MKKNRIGWPVTSGALALGLLAFFLFKPASDRSAVSRTAQAWAQGMESAPAITQRHMPAQVITQDWPERSKKVAAIMVEKYGQPDSHEDNSLIWHDKGPWKRTIVHRAGYHDRSMARPDAVLQQTVNYRVPLAKFKELELFDPRLAPNRARNELSMRSESEPMNFLAINLADEIIVGWRDVDEAKGFHAQVSELARSGKSSPYMEGLRFQPDK
jgi:hypothetical protein